MLEQLAALAHEQWSGWMNYLFSKCEQLEDGSVSIPAGYAEALRLQMITAYVDLSAEEQEADRREAQRFLRCLFGTEVVAIVQHYSGKGDGYGPGRFANKDVPVT